MQILTTAYNGKTVIALCTAQILGAGIKPRVYCSRENKRKNLRIQNGFEWDEAQNSKTVFQERTKREERSHL